MNEYQAQQQGYNYCGPSISNWPNKRECEIWEEDKKFAKQIKKEYTGADYVIVTGTATGWLGSGSRAIYGNSIFRRVYDLLRHDNIENYQERLKLMRERAEAEYKKALDEIAATEARFNDNLNFLESLKK